MSIILKEEASNSIPTPGSGKATLFVDDNGVMSVKNDAGTTTTFPTLGTSNTQVLFTDGTAIGGDNDFVYNKNTNVLTLAGNLAAANVKTDNLLYANGVPWNLGQDPGGSNTQIQFNNDGNFGASANFTFDSSTNTLVLAGTANVTNFNATGNAIIGGNLYVNGNVVYVNVETLDVEDPIIQLGGGPNGAAPVADDGKDRGTALNYYSSAAKVAFMGWDNSNSEFGMGSVVSIVNDVVTFTTYGNLRVGNILGNGQALTGITGANVTGTVANATHASTANTVVDAAQPNITSVGTLSSITTSGNAVANNFNATTYVTAASIYSNSGTISGQYISASVDVTANRDVMGGNVYANSGIVGAVTGNFSGNVSAGNVKTDNLLYANGSPWDLSDPGGSNTEIQFNDSESFGGSAAFTFNKSSNVVTVSANLNANNLNATTHVTAGNVYANLGTIGGALLTGTLTTASQPNVTALGTLSSLGVSGNVTAGNLIGPYANGNTKIDIPSANGNLNVTAAGNANILVVSGTGVTVNGDFTATGNANIGNGSGGNISGANNISANTLTGTLTTAAQPNITSVGSLSSLTVTGNAGANNFNATTHVTAGNVYANSGTVGGSLLTGTLTTASQPNVTSLGTLSSLAVTANVTAGNVYANSGTVGGSLLAGTLTTASQPNVTSIGTLTSLAVTGNVTSGNVYANSGTIGASLLTGTLTTASQPNITSVGTLTSLTVSGNISGGNITGGALANGNSNVNIPAAAGNVNISVNGTANVAVVTATGVNVAGTLNATGNVSGGNLTTAGALSVTGNANTGNLGTTTLIATTGNITTINSGLLQNGNSNIAITANGNVSIQAAGSTVELVVTSTGANISGTLNATGNANVGNIGAAAGVFTGNISSLNANLGNLVAANVANLVDLNVTGNANIGGGSGGNLSGANVITANTFVGNLQGQVANGNSNLNIPAANGNINLSVGGTSNVLIVTSTGVNVTGTLNSSGNANVGNLGTAGLITATGNVSGGNLTTAGLVSATGNVSGGNLTTAGKVVASTLESNVSTGTAPFVVASTTKVTNLNADLLDGYSTATAATANTVVIRDADGSFSANVVTATLSGAATTAGTVTTAAQPNITSVGTLTSLGVNGTVTAVAFTANTGVFTGNGSGLSAIAGGNVTGQVANALIAGTVYTNAQPNITSVGTLSSVSVTGNVAAGNLTTTGVLSVTGTGVSSIAGNLDMTSNTIINLATPTNASDAATKQYVDDLASTALIYHEGVTAATTDTLANTTGGTITYNNGASGVGANLVTTGSFNLIDTANVQTVGTRILVKNEANAAHNGIYTWANATTIVRSTDADESGPGAGSLSLNDYFFVSGGSVNKGSAYVLDSPSGTITFGTSNITFAQFSSSQVYSNGTGLGLSGTVFSVNASQTQVTALGTVTTGTWNSLVGSSATFAAGLSGANLASITGANVTGTVPAATVAGTVTTAAQPNITSVGTLTSLGVNGTVTAVAFTANTGVFTGNGSGLSAIAGANVTGTVSSATTAGTVTTAAQPNITSVGTLSSLSVTGNANVGNIGAAAGVFTTVSGNGAALTDLNASNISSGTLAQARLANSSLTVNGTAISLGGSGTITANTTQTLTLGSYLTGTSFNGGTAVTAAVDATTTNTASKVVARDASGNFAAGTITATLSGAATTAGTVTTAAQPNITSVGTLTSLSVSGGITNANLTTGANTTAGSLTGNWTLTAGSRLQATYADLAERYVSDAGYEPGTVLLFGGELEVTMSNEFDSHRVAGVVSTDPAYIMNSGCQGEHVVDLALQGRVPVKVHGPVAKGDLMVSGPNGHAVANNMARAGTIIGKSLENFSGGYGVIEVVIGRF